MNLGLSGSVPSIHLRLMPTMWPLLERASTSVLSWSMLRKNSSATCPEMRTQVLVLMLKLPKGGRASLKRKHFYAEQSRSIRYVQKTVDMSEP